MVAVVSTQVARPEAGSADEGDERMSTADRSMIGRLKRLWSENAPASGEDVALIARVFRTYFKRFRSTYAVIFVLIFATAGATGAAVAKIKTKITA